MHRIIRLAGAVAAATALGGGVAVATATTAGAAATGTVTPPGPGHTVVFVQTDATANQVVAYDQARGGALTLAGTYPTGGLGGTLDGSVVDHLASQGSLTYDPQQDLLVAVNAGSDTVSAFTVHGDHLSRPQVISSGGQFPVSVAVHGSLVYVLNAEGGGSVQGYVAAFGRLFPLPGSKRNLGLTIPTGTTQFTNTPGQVAFTPDGSQLVVTTKANGDDIDVFGIGPQGRPTASPVVNPEAGTVPFAVTFDAAGHLVVAEAGTDALATFTLAADGTVSPIDTVGTGQKATCWVAPADGYLYASNAGSADVSDYAETAAGQLTLLGATPTDPGTVDAAATPDGQFLYVQTGGTGTVDGFQVEPDGSLTATGSVVVAGAAGGEGIVAV